MNLEQKKETLNGLTYNYLCHIQHIDKKGTVFPAHYHSYIEILYCLNGIYEVVLNGKSHHFKEGDVVLINSKEIHLIQSMTNQKGQYIVLRFEPEVIYNSMFQNYQELKYVLPFLLEHTMLKKVIEQDVISKTFLPELFFEILKEFEEEAFGYELAIKNHIGRIFLWILRYFHQSDSSFDAYLSMDVNFHERLRPAFDYMETHYFEDIKAPDMAALCNMSSSYFSRVFHRQMKLNFNEYLNYLRIKEAEKQLISSSNSVTEIATNLGFSSTSYFIKLFKDSKHISPKQFQKEFAIQKIYKNNA